MIRERKKKLKSIFFILYGAYTTIKCVIILVNLWHYFSHNWFADMYFFFFLPLPSFWTNRLLYSFRDVSFPLAKEYSQRCWKWYNTSWINEIFNSCCLRTSKTQNRNILLNCWNEKFCFISFTVFDVFHNTMFLFTLCALLVTRLSRMDIRNKTIPFRAHAYCVSYSS